MLNVPMPTNPALEAAIRETKSDPGPVGVYADWLQAQDSPLGELIALEAKLENTPQDHQLRRRRNDLVKLVGMPSPKLATWTYRHGLWQSLRLENSEDWMDEKFDPDGLARKLFATPFCVALDELRIGILRWDHNHEDVPTVLRIAGDYAWAKSLESLHLGDVGDNIDMDHHVIGIVGERISQTFPALRSLRLHSGSQSWRGAGETFSFAGLALPKLEKLVIETCAMSSERARDAMTAKLPALETLELWFGSQQEAADATLDDLRPLFEGAFPKVTRLALRNQELGIDLVEALAASKLAKQLVTLDLSMSTLDDDAADDFVDLAKQFPALTELNVDDNFLTAAGLDRLRGAVKTVTSSNQSKLEYAEENERFASIRE